MLHPPPFPISIDELTPATLTQALGTEVVRFSHTRIGADRGMLGAIYLLDLTYVDPSDDSPPSKIVVKYAAQREESLASARRGRAHERELRCYLELLPETPVRSPAAYGAWYDEGSANFMLLQDAVDVDPTVDQIVGLSQHQIRLVLTQAARLHAHWWKRPELLAKDWLPRLDGEGRRANMSALSKSGWSPLCDLLGDQLTPAEVRLGTSFPDRLDAALCAAANRPSTLIHSDLRADNLLFSPDGSSVTIVDWQGCGQGPPSFELAYLLSQSLTVEDRRNHEDELLAFYQAELASAGREVSMDQILDGYGEAFLYPLGIACALPLIGDRREPRVKALAHTTARRSLEALRDHNQLWEDSP